VTDTKVALRAARPSDLPVVETLLAAAELTRAGLADAFADFIVAEQGGGIIGAAGMERYGDYGLLRSVVVAPAARDSGIGALMVRALTDASRDRGVRELWLLTTTADRYFPRFGFAVAERSAVPAPLLQSIEFRGACPATAVVMRRSLADREAC